MKFRKSESGNVLVLTAMCLSLLVGFIGLALDVGMLFRTRQNVQIAADAAATAGALDYIYNGSTTSAQAAACAAASANGFAASPCPTTTPCNGCLNITINTPPTSGPVTSAGYVEAIVSSPNNEGFMSLFGFKKVNVTARAVAGAPIAGNSCMFFPKPTGKDIIYLKGSTSVTANCGITVNSNDTNAVEVHDNGVSLSATYFDVVGNDSPKFQTSPTPLTPNSAPRSTPWGTSLSGPSISGSGCNVTFAGATVTTANLAQASGSTTNPVVCFTNTSGVTLQGVSLPGASSGTSDIVYVFEHGVSISGSVSIGSGSYNSTSQTFTNTSGAMMDIYGGSFGFSGGSTSFQIYAPTYGTYNGIAILQPSTNSNELQLVFGSSSVTLDGYIYAPNSEVYLQDEGGDVVATGMVAGSLDTNSSFTAISYDGANLSTTLNRAVVMVE